MSAINVMVKWGWNQVGERFQENLKQRKRLLFFYFAINHILLSTIYIISF